MKPDKNNIEGQKIHKYIHEVSHEVNWSHVLGFLVALVIVWRLGPVIADATAADEQDNQW